MGILKKVIDIFKGNINNIDIENDDKNVVSKENLNVDDILYDKLHPLDELVATKAGYIKVSLDDNILKIYGFDGKFYDGIECGYDTLTKMVFYKNGEYFTLHVNTLLRIFEIKRGIK